MSLTDIMLFGKAIYGGSGGSSDSGKTVVLFDATKRDEYTESQLGEHYLYKLSDKVLTLDEIKNGNIAVLANDDTQTALFWDDKYFDSLFGEIFVDLGNGSVSLSLFLVVSQSYIDETQDPALTITGAGLYYIDTDPNILYAQLVCGA